MYGKSVAVLPQPVAGASPLGSSIGHPKPRSLWRFYILCAYNGVVWGLLTLLLFAQVLAIVWNSVTYKQLVYFGHPTIQGMASIAGSNDELYADRAIVCVLDDHALRPVQLSEALRQSRPEASMPTKGIDGIRVVLRDVDSLAQAEAATLSDYERKCEALAMTLDAILDACEAVGYNVTRDALWVSPGLEAQSLTILKNALPVVFVPFWDRGSVGRYVVPGRDGCACVFRSFGLLESPLATYAHFAATPRAVRDAKAQEWLPGGQWRNGWLVDPTGVSWFVHVTTSVTSDQAELPFERFDLLNVSAGSTRHIDCSLESCASESTDVAWGDQLQFRSGTDWFRTVFVSNGLRFGLFFHEAMDVLTVTASYHLDQLISNVTLATLLMRWLVAMLALSKTHETIGVGALANSRSFCLLPLLLLPRLKTSLEGFWTAGCQFEGDQKALSEAWFIMYPAIGEVVLIYFSVLNTLAKLLRRRMTDALFGPTLLFFGLLHYCRFELANSKWLDYDGRITAVVTATEADSATVFSFVLSDFAWRMNGQVTSLFVAKAVVLVLNLVPLIIGSRDVAKRKPNETLMRDVEVALAMRFGWNGGLGLSPIYEASHYDNKAAKLTPVVPYELVRGGFVVMDYDATPSSQTRQHNGLELKRGFLVLTIDHWLWFVFLTPHHLGNWWRSLLVFRVVVFEAYSPASAVNDCPLALEMKDVHPLPCRVGEPRFQNVRPWRVSALAVT